MLVQNRFFTAEPQSTRRRNLLFGGRYRQMKRLPFRKTRLMIATTVIKRISLKPEEVEFLILSPPPDWIRRKIFLCGLCDSAVKPGVEKRDY